MLGAINWHTFFFLLFGGIACGFSVAVLVSSNIVRMAFYLIVALAATAALFILAGAHFVGAMQIMIYVGGTLVLLIFGVMLTAQAAFVSMKTHSADWVMGLIVGGALLALLTYAAVSVADWRQPRADQREVNVFAGETATPLGWGLIGVRVDKPLESDAVLRDGMSGYLLPFEIIAVHLLVVLIGAAYLARTRRRVLTRATAPAEALP
jgi:NADH-quinone oxidoreductase subunit J